MYRLLVFLHVGSAFLFMLAHGATAAAMFRLRREREPAVIAALLEVRRWAEIPFNLSSAVMFLSGIALGFMGRWWSSGWIWTSLGLLVAITLVMGIFGRQYLDRAAALVEPGPVRADAEPVGDIEDTLDSGRPMLLAVTGIGSFLAIVWLMMFKPF